MVHGYTTDFIKANGVDPKEAYSAYRAYVGDSYVSSHYLLFDWDRVLAPELTRLSESKTTILAFVQEIGGALPSVLDTWLKSNWGERVFVASDKALYQGDKVLAQPDPGKSFGWWTFTGLTKFLQDASKP